MSIILKEQAAGGPNISTYSQLWVKNTTPCQLWYTNEDNTGWSGKITTSGYETGTWNPVVSSGADSYQDVCTYNWRNAQYVKIGYMIYFWFDLQLASNGVTSTGDVIIVWLPWVADWNYKGFTSLSFTAGLTLTSAVDVHGEAYNGDYPLISLYKQTSKITSSALKGLDLGTNTQLVGGGMFKTIYEGDHGYFGSTYSGH